ncbi:hypothetical protein B0H10DRAFT_945481 [Mycena sp. CBHHK59/15]|nr:hypothetical protein B0H10DRAFT_945481 [Mycena sp. CBHHK59/15]
MPADLPGFYFDTARNRYFPLSSRSKPQTPHSHPDPHAPTPKSGLAQLQLRPTLLWSAAESRPLPHAPRARASQSVCTGVSYVLSSTASSALLRARVADTTRAAHERVRWPLAGGSAVTVFRVSAAPCAR